MRELRHDPIQKRWVIIASERSLRPQQESAPEPVQHASECPFCEGNEDRTPPEITAVRSNGHGSNRPGWSVRVVPNKFPALAIEGSLGRRGMGLHDVMNGVGAHEVIIETPRHDAQLQELSLQEMAQVLRTYRNRLVDLSKDRRFKYVLLFKNHGARAGASLAHPHTQLIATPVTPKIVAGELAACKDHFRLKERCLICDIIDQELQSRQRIVFVNDDFVAFTPFASRFPYEIFLAPRAHSHSFAEVRDSSMEPLAAVLKEVLQKMQHCLDSPPYNFVIHTSPNTEATPRRSTYWDTLEADYHWHIEIMPRLTSIAGFEWGTGFYINPTAPEIAARELRDALRA